MLSILALDLSSNVGWAARRSDGTVVSGSFAVGKTGKDVGVFLKNFRTWLYATIDETDAEIVLFEQPVLPRGTSMATLRKLYSLAGLTELVCRDHQIACKEVPVQTWRKAIVGMARAPKDVPAKERRKFIKKKTVARLADMGFPARNDDEADALGILMYGIASLGGRA